jgi:site-specific DNA recombinase
METLTVTVRTSQMAGQQARERAVSRMAEAERLRSSSDSWAGEPAAIYCRASHVKDQDQTSVDRQERICRDTAGRLGLSVVHVLIDPNRSAWKRNRSRPGWDELLQVAANDGVRHIVVYHPDRLMRQPFDLEELLTIADRHGIILHGKSGHRDLSDPDDRHYLRGEVAHACRSSDDTSRRLKDAMVDRARDGKPHSGMRRFGYSKDGMSIIEPEAEWVRWIFRSYLDGMSPRAISGELTKRNVPAVRADRWGPSQVLSVLDSRRVAGIRVFRGVEIGPGVWPAIIDAAMFREVQDRRAYRAPIDRAFCLPRRYYLLRGLVWCGKCGRRMGGKNNGGRPLYACFLNNHPEFGPEPCARRISAEPLEAFVKDAAISLLERLDVSGNRAVALPAADQAAIEADRAEIAELRDMWDRQEIRTAEYRQMRKVIEDRIRKIQDKAIIRPAAEVLDGITGSQARQKWETLEQEGDVERLNAILRFLFAAIRIGESRAPRGRFDYGRIEIEQNPI